VIIGVCGGSGSGKSYVCSILSSHGYPLIDADKIYHALVSSKTECTDAIEKRFGNAVFNPDGSLDRRALAAIVFSDDLARNDLNRLTHHFVLKEMERLIADCFEKGENTVICDVPLLFESGFDKKCDLKVAVIADYDVRILRIAKRDNITVDEAQRRIAKQINDDFLIKKCDFVIYNNSGAEEIIRQLTPLLEKINY
jgi:dephospho-CoA kinase